MPLFYRAVQASLANKDGNKLWHLNLVKAGETVDTQQLAETIAEKSSLTPGDVQNVVRNLMSAMRDYLLNSRTVRLDGLGTFTMKASTRGNGVESADKVNPNQISHLKCQFTAEYTRPAAIGTTRALVQGVQFMYADLLKSSTKGDTPSGGGDGEGEDPAA
ncbi:HU family DNA-binding protein [Bacteroides salyersiae]|mgnify:CR=1 FL=1|jgi:predicted histone-like DNA-binding protein|uniref:HU family DNA-binding protein n=1 Tax=Bacteroides salyersiae TaxID=291644 RepID=UPI001C8C9B53|nr:HU family DNA-binding protein [Bacteroides salyersiae]